MTESYIIQHNSTTTSTTTNTECIQDNMQPVIFLDNTTVDHKSISLHHTSDKSTAVKSSTTATVSFALPDDPTQKE